ncbi:MAG: DUF2029 domain-containing protein [Alphaproteobacteria bacterium]|nr:MAG: DUF2029 domain-containing protein [Alphaproteobacteria bacterium]
MNRWRLLSNFLGNRLFHLIILLSITFGISLLSYRQPVGLTDGVKHPGYNNYLIFKNSSIHLLNNQNLYAAYPDEQFDLYKYSPAFALFMSPFRLLPDLAGLIIWNLLNLLVLYFALTKLPQLSDWRRSLLFWFVVLEMAGNMIYEQSNTLITGLIVFAFICMEKNKPFWASLLLVLTFYIKIFGIAAGILFLLYPNRRRLIGYSVFWTVILALLPGFFTGFDALLQQYSWWVDLLQSDHGREINFSMMGLLKFYLNIEAFNIWWPLGGAIILLIPFLRFNHYSVYGFRLLIASSLLMWLLIFNHMAEPSTFIIQMTGIGLWYFPFRRKAFDLALLLATLFLISLVGLDIFPHTWRDEFFGPYKVKAMPGIIIWIKVSIEAIFPSLRPDLLINQRNSFFLPPNNDKCI